MHEHDGLKPHSHEVRHDHCGVPYSNEQTRCPHGVLTECADCIWETEINAHVREDEINAALDQCKARINALEARINAAEKRINAINAINAEQRAEIETIWWYIVRHVRQSAKSHEI